jgi:hypothetical protein
VEAVELDDERGLAPPLLALRIVAVGPDPGHQDVADLVLAGRVQDERVLDAGRQDGLPVAGHLALGPAHGGVIGVRERDDLGGHPPTRGTHDGRVRVRQHHRILTPQADAGAPVPGEFHAFDSDTGDFTPDHARCCQLPDPATPVRRATPAPSPEGLAHDLREKEDGERLPNRRSPSEGGRVERWRMFRNEQ